MIPAVLRVEETSAGRWSAPHPEDDPEGRDIVFSGQVLAQMIMASSAAAGGEKEIKSIHAIFARAGRYSAGPLDLVLESMHAGRAWASDTITVSQGGKLLSRGLVLLNSIEPDLIRHAPGMPDVAGPEGLDPMPTGVVFPGSEARMVPQEKGASTLYVWVRSPERSESVAVNQAMVAWGQPGFIIGAALGPHPELDLSQAHRTISTGVISHTAHFHEQVDAGEWLLFVHEGSYAGRGRVFGSGAVYTAGGSLVSTFAQDSMARKVEGELDPSKAM